MHTNGSGTLTRADAALALAGAALAAPSAGHGAPVPLPQNISGGGGSTWFIRNTGGTSNGLPAGGACDFISPGLTVLDASILGQGDAYDRAAIVFVDDTIYAPPGGVVDLTGQTLTGPAVPLGGLDVTVQYFFDPASATLRTLVTLANPTAGAITVPVDWMHNVGADGGFTVTGTASGDATFDPADRWVASDDVFHTDDADPALTFVLFGPDGPPVTPSGVSTTVFECSGTQGIRATYELTVGAGETAALLFFNQLYPTTDDALAGVTAFDTTPAPGDPLLDGLSEEQLASVVNWDFFPAAEEVEVAFDVRPQGCRNPLNSRAGGVLPAAILGTADLDVRDIDPATVLLEGVAPQGFNYEDVATPFEPFVGKSDPFDCTTAGPDSFEDLTLTFDNQAIVAAVGPVARGDVLVLEVTGELVDDTPIVGEDVVVVIQ